MQFKKQVDQWIADNKLVKIEVLKGRGVRQTLLGRILKFDVDDRIVLLYDPDAKQVRNLKFAEIETMQPVD
ncbi:hypothetical protein [Effusibacillus lacus]|uniref:Uncharacterized protein n=1 Tax=Effusibacillus lacus TaxID=1348429 RepID=A0A292YNZ0_9BACL|nr:hypothetical protein [Effusibacillus lacus]TCS68258.1 hypothetical protein EDD64_1444 [Effusibacillus lacus]GAX90190.1 hypothetical protein EFBL_1816 [Effusibacillus lacus]